MAQVLHCSKCGNTTSTACPASRRLQCARCGYQWDPFTKNAACDGPVAARFNTGKREYHLVPREAVDAIADVLNYGAGKYEDRNWEKGGPLKVPYNSLERHKLSWLTGEDNDQESGLPHLSHMMANLAFLVTYTQRGIGEDFRPRAPHSRVPLKISSAHQ